MCLEWRKKLRRYPSPGPMATHIWPPTSLRRRKTFFLIIHKREHDTMKGKLHFFAVFVDAYIKSSSSVCCEDMSVDSTAPWQPMERNYLPLGTETQANLISLSSTGSRHKSPINTRPSSSYCSLVDDDVAFIVSFFSLRFPGLFSVVLFGANYHQTERLTLNCRSAIKTTIEKIHKAGEGKTVQVADHKNKLRFT